MALPIVAIVGRPNVGKSSLLNALVGRRISIVDPTPGVTRDRVSAPCPLPTDDPQADDGGWVELIDTGGMGIEDADKLTDHVESQIDYGLQAAALILFVVDARHGISVLDQTVAERLRKARAPVLLVANKIDQASVATELGELHGLGFGDPLPISATHNQGLTDLLEAVADKLGPDARQTAPESMMRLAVVGKRNAGKSTFTNALAGSQRVIVSQTPGTTRDSVDVIIERNGKQFVLIDTAGVRKKRSIKGDIDFYSHHRAMRSVRRADVVAMMIDAAVPVSQVDRALVGEIAQQLKPVVLVVNKWDLAGEHLSGEDYAEYFAKTFPEVAYAPISLTSAAQGRNVDRTVKLAEELYRQSQSRIATGPLNQAIEKIMAERGPSHKSSSRRPKVFYASQIATGPPTIAFVVNDPRSFDHNYQRFLLNRLRDYVPFPEIPIRLVFRHRKGRDA